MTPNRTTQTFHVHHDGRRTSVSLDTVLCELLCLAFGVEPYSVDGHQEIQASAQFVIETEEPEGSLSLWLSRKFMLLLVSPNLLVDWENYSAG